jgi:hypothetical protein
MTRARTFTIAGIILLSAAIPVVSQQSPVTFESPCSCRDNHGKYRLAVKNDPSTPPADASAVQAVTPRDIFAWAGPAVHLTRRSKRTPAENNGSLLLGAWGDLDHTPALRCKPPQKDTYDQQTELHGILLEGDRARSLPSAKVGKSSKETKEP